MAPLSLGSSCAPESLSYAGGQIADFIVKGRARMPDPEVRWWEFLKPFIILGWCQWIGAAIFIWGWLHQLHCHAILVGLTLSICLHHELILLSVIQNVLAILSSLNINLVCYLAMFVITTFDRIPKFSQRFFKLSTNRILKILQTF